MTGGQTVLECSGDIVERQSYLNGSRYYLIEGEAELAGARWVWTLSVTLPKENGEAINEGDLLLVAGPRSWFADVVGGRHVEMVDEALDTPVLAVEFTLAQRLDGESTEPWQDGSATLNLGVDTCDLVLALNSTPGSGVGDRP
jgi:hypothetical protein